MSLLGNLKQLPDRARKRSRTVDHALGTQEHVSAVAGSQLAGGVTYFGFLSVFPVLAIAFFAVGYVARVYPDAQENLLTAIDEVLPGLVGTGEGQISIQSIEDSASTVGLIGLAGVLYAGLGWLSSLRVALRVLFEEPLDEQPNFVVGKLRDLMTLALLGVVLMASVAVSGVVTRYSTELLDLVGLGTELGWLVTLVALVLGLAASTLLMYLMFRLLAQPPTPRRALWQGALLGAVGFEVLKQLSSVLLASTEGQPAFQAFGIALILLVWINYFSRVIVYAAAWSHTSHTSRAARALRAEAAAVECAEPGVAEVVLVPQAGVVAAAPSAASGWVRPFAAGGAVMLALVAAVRRGRGEPGE